MARALSLDLRQRIVDAVENGLSRRAAANRFAVSESSAITPQTLGEHLKKRRRELGLLPREAAELWIF